MMNPDIDNDVAFSIHACDRCRKRKARCDPGIPSCQGCLASGSICASTDSRTKQTVPRSQVTELEAQICQLEEKLRRLGVEREDADRDGMRECHTSSRSLSGRNSTEDEHHQPPDLIRVESAGDGHFLGASSGLHLARSVLESARRNSAAFDEHDPSALSSQEPAAGDESNTEGDGAMTETTLPSWETVTRLVELFFRHYEIQYPILQRDKFVKDASNLYFGNDPLERVPGNPWIIFMLNMVVSISLAFIDDPDSAKLAERFRRNATAQLSNVMQTKSHHTLQCLLLLLLSSTLGSRSAPMWYISGICMRMCVDLGYHSEKTIWHGVDDGRRSDDDDDDPDTKRRLFWVTYTFDRSLAKMLGRPFFIDDEKIDVEFPTTSLPEHAKTHILHWLTMQRIQSEIVSHVYVLDRANPQGPSLHSTSSSSSSAWAAQMEQRLSSWFAASRQLETRGGRYTAEWWEYWYQHARLMLNQPRPRATKKSLVGAFDAAETMVRLSFVRAHRSVAEFSWLDVHLQLVSGLTMLFLVLKSPHLRERARGDWLRFKGCVVEWEVVLGKLVKRWGSMAKMRTVLSRLADGVLDCIENNKLPGGQGGRQQRNSPRRRDRHDTRLAMEELSAPLELSRRTRSRCPRSSSQPAAAETRKRRRGISITDGSQGHKEDPSPTSIDMTPPSTQQVPPPPPPPQQQQQQHQTENTTYYPWLEAGDNGSGGALDSIDFPSVLGGELFTDIDQLGAPLQLDLVGLFDQQAELAADPGAEPFGLQWLAGRLDATLTDSVLNFRGGLEEPRRRMDGGDRYPAQYQ